MWSENCPAAASCLRPRLYWSKAWSPFSEAVGRAAGWSTLKRFNPKENGRLAPPLSRFEGFYDMKLSVGPEPLRFGRARGRASR